MELNKRILPDKVIPLEFYCNSLLYLTEMLTYDLGEFLKLEGRFMGMAKSYINSMWTAYSGINDYTNEEEDEVFERILYLFKKIIIKEYTSLKNKKLSSGDCIIVILKKIYEIILGTNIEDYKYTRRIQTLYKLISKFYDNIRNRKKSSKLFNLSNNIKYYMERGWIGKFRLKKIILPDFENNLKSTLCYSGERLDQENDKMIKEINL